MSDENEFRITLAIDGIYYGQAKFMCELASTKDKEFIASQKPIEETKQGILNYLNNPKRSDDDEDEEVFDHFSSELHRHWQPVSLAATELIRTVATVHILCATCLEAHINIRAERTLTGKHFDEFDKLSLSGKWLFYSALIGGKCLDPGRQPFQSFQRLVKFRNALVHYRVKSGRSKTYDPYDVPPFVKELGLRSEAAVDSVSIVREMVAELAKIESREVPEWIAADHGSAFDWE
jgi:hypothetical protein